MCRHCTEKPTSIQGFHSITGQCLLLSWGSIIISHKITFKNQTHTKIPHNLTVTKVSSQKISRIGVPCTTTLGMGAPGTRQKPRTSPTSPGTWFGVPQGELFACTAQEHELKWQPCIPLPREPLGSAAGQECRGGSPENKGRQQRSPRQCGLHLFPWQHTPRPWWRIPNP